MERLNLLGISASFFLLSYIFNAFIRPADDKATQYKFFDIIPFVIIMGTSNLPVFISDFYVYKVALFVLFSVQSLYLLLERELDTNVLHLLAYLLAMLTLLSASLNVHIPLTVLNGANIILQATVIILQIRQYQATKLKQHKEIAEVYMIALIGVIVMSYGHSYFLINFGFIIYIVYQLSELLVLLKFYRASQISIRTRLSDLENKFERTVEFEAKKRTSHMADKVEYIREKSQKDPMTKAYNRNGLVDIINDLINDSTVKIFSIAMFDIDHFKTINDTKGHIVGDECLKYLTYAFIANNRKTDYIGRYGGDEFVFIMPHVNAPGALDIAERMRLEIQTKSVPNFTISMGIATYPYDGRSFSSLLEVADTGLYAAKEAGRNNVKYRGNVFTTKK